MPRRIESDFSGLSASQFLENQEERVDKADSSVWSSAEAFDGDNAM